MRLTAIPILFCCVALQAATPFDGIIDLSRSVPPEFGADALLRIVESGRIADKKANIALAEEAFRMGGNAQYKVKMRGLPGALPDTRSGYLTKAYDLDLDALSLQSRAVRDLLPLDKAKARELFGDIVMPALPPLTCESPLVYDVSEFYRTAGLIASTAFTPAEIAKEEQVAFLLHYVSAVTSPVQLAPVARMIRDLKFKADQNEAIAARFGTVLENLSGDDRSFSATVSELDSQITPEWKPAFTKYITRQLTGARCEDDVKVTMQYSGEALKPDKLEGNAAIDSFWESEDAKRMMSGVMNLRFGNGHTAVLSDADRGSSPWEQQLTDFLRQLSEWNASSEKSEADYFNQKCMVYAALVELIPPGPDRDHALEAFLSFINSSNLQRQSPVEWFVGAHTLLERIRTTNGGEPGKVMDAYVSSGNPVLALYVGLEKAFGSGVPAWVTKAAAGSLQQR